jgi:hypothetical protein
MPIRNHGVTLNLTRDEALVLAELLTRYRMTSRLDLLHPSEYVSLLNLSKKLEKSLGGPSDRDYQASLAQAQSDLVSGFEGEVPGLNYAG